MHVWNVLHAARWKYRTQKSPFWHHRTTLSACIFAVKAHIDNWKKLVKYWYPFHMSAQYGELQHSNGWDLLASLGHPCTFQPVLRIGSVTARHSSIGRQPNFAALNRGRHLYSARRPSRWAWGKFLVSPCLWSCIVKQVCCYYFNSTYWFTAKWPLFS